MIKTELYNKLKEIRHFLHAHPELSNLEMNTAAFVVQKLKEISLDIVIHTVGPTGICAVFESGKDGPTILIRGDMDALPIQEVNTFAHRSTVNNVSHMCGHDGHTTILLGLAHRLAELPISRGRVILVFQPGEENGTGAKEMLNDPFWDSENVNYAFALHNLPGYQKNTLVIKKNAFTAHVNTMILQLDGVSAHAAEPECGVNPTYAFADIVSVCRQTEVSDTDKDDFYLMTPVYSRIGQKAYGISAHRADIRITVRAWDTEVFEKKTTRFLQRVEEIVGKHGLTMKVSWTHEFFANRNADVAVDLIEGAGMDLGLNIVKRSRPFKWGEDFGLFTQKYTGAMFGLGAGIDTPALHNPDYDFPDEIIPVGVALFEKMIREIFHDV